jgi:hypothetical protein
VEFISMEEITVDPLGDDITNFFEQRKEGCTFDDDCIIR